MPSPWRDPGRLVTAPGDRAAQTVRWSVLALATGADLFLIQSTFNRVLAAEPWKSWVVSSGMALAALIGMYLAGAVAHRAHAESLRTQRVLSSVVVVVWFLVGAGLFALRWWSADLIAVSDVTESVGGPVTSGDTTAIREHLTAGAMATVFLLSGVLAFVDGWLALNPVDRVVKATERHLDDAHRDVAAAEADYARLRETLSLHEAQLAHLDEDLEVALQARRALATELRRQSRILIAQAMGDPAATGLVRPVSDTPEDGGDAPVLFEVRT